MTARSELNAADNPVKKLVKYVQSFNKGEKVNNLFALNFALMATNSLLMPVRESLTLEGGKQLQTKLMMLTVIVSVGGQAIFAYYSGKHGGLPTLRKCFLISGITCLSTYCCLLFAPSIRMLFSSVFYLWFTFYNMTSMSTFWAIAGDVLEEPAGDSKIDAGKKTHNKKIGIFSHLAAGGTLGHMLGSSLSTVLLRRIGSHLCLPVLSAGFFASISLCGRIQKYQRQRPVDVSVVSSGSKSDASIKSNNSPTASADKKPLLSVLSSELSDQIKNVGMIWNNPVLYYSFMYSVMLSTSLGLTVIERTIAAKGSGLSADEYANVLAGNQILHGALQFVIQLLGSGAMISMIGTVAALTAAGLGRFCSFVAFFVIQAQFFPSLTSWYSSSVVIPVSFVIIADLICRLITQTISKPVRESLWVLIPKSNKYRSKIIVDVLAHRIGTSFAAFLANTPLLSVVNGLLSTSPLFSSLCVGLTGEASFKFEGFLGQDHIIWGILATVLLCFFGVCMGRAVNNAKAKVD